MYNVFIMHCCKLSHEIRWILAFIPFLERQKANKTRVVCDCYQQVTKEAIEMTQNPRLCALTWADKLLLLYLGHIMPPEVWWGHALCVQAQAGALSQPLRQPGDMAVTLQVVGVQAAVEEDVSQERLADKWWEQLRAGREEIIDLRTGESEGGGVQGHIDQSVAQAATEERSPLPEDEDAVKTTLTRSAAWACGWSWPQTGGWCCCCLAC